MIALLSDPKDHLLQLILRMQLSLSLKTGKQSKMKAADLYWKAHSVGIADATFRLGEMYEKGMGTNVDLGRAAEWMRRSVRLGDPAHGAERARDWLAARELEA